MVDPLFGGVFWGNMFSSIGAWMHSVVAAIVIFQASQSALLVGFVSVAEFAPQLVLSPLSGKWADRGHAVSQILLGRILCCLGSGGLALWMCLTPGASDTSVTVAVLSATVVVGFGFVIGGPAMQSIIPSLIRRGELPAAMSLTAAPMTIARIVGPVLGALMTVRLGAAAGFAAAAGTHLVFVIVVAVVRLPRGKKWNATADYAIRTALRHVRWDRPLLLMLVATAAIGFGSEPSVTLAPALASALDGGAQLVGELTTYFGIGAAIGLVIISALNRHVRSATSSALGLWVMALGLGVSAASMTVWMALCAFGITGAGFSIATVGIMTLVQERAPDLLRGRIMALWMVGFIGSRPFAATLVGIMADTLSVELSLLFTAALMAVIAVKCRPRALKGPIPHKIADQKHQ